MSKVAVLLLNWNNSNDTVECIQSLEESDHKDFVIAVLDNGSRSSEKESLTRSLSSMGASITEINGEEPAQSLGVGNSKIALFLGRTNLGYAQGYNYLSKWAADQNFDYLFILNNDARVQPSTIRTLIEASKRYSRDFLGASVMNEMGTELSFSGTKWPYDLFGLRRPVKQAANSSIKDVSYVEGSALFLANRLAKDLLDSRKFLFDPKFFMYCEDADLSLYANQCMQQTPTLAAQATVLHHGSKSGGGAGNPIAYYYLTRSRIYLANRWLPPPLKIAFHFYYVPSRLLILLTKGFRRTRTVNKAVVEGLKDGYLGRYGKWNHHESVFEGK